MFSLYFYSSSLLPPSPSLSLGPRGAKQVSHCYHRWQITTTMTQREASRTNVINYNISMLTTVACINTHVVSSRLCWHAFTETSRRTNPAACQQTKWSKNLLSWIKHRRREAAELKDKRDEKWKRDSAIIWTRTWNSVARTSDAQAVNVKNTTIPWPDRHVLSFPEQREIHPQKYHHSHEGISPSACLARFIATQSKSVVPKIWFDLPNIIRNIKSRTMR
jgi:hypothetical protein